jgi:hypothetical protein
MTISKMIKNTKGTLSLHKVPFLIIMLALLTIAAILMGIYGANQFSASGDPNLTAPTPTPTPAEDPLGGNIEGSGGGPMFVLPEYGAFGGIIALAISFLAFGLFMQRQKLSKKYAE